MIVPGLFIFFHYLGIDGVFLPDYRVVLMARVALRQPSIANSTAWGQGILLKAGGLAINLSLHSISNSSSSLRFPPTKKMYLALI